MTEIVRPVWDFAEYEKFLPQGGFIYDYVYYGIQTTDAPPEYHLVNAIALASIAIAPQMDFVFRDITHPLHLFQLIVGDSSASRKTSSIKRATRLAVPVFERVSSAGSRVFWPSTSSPEGLLDELAKEPNRLLVYSEWTDNVRQQSAKYWGHAQELINTMYDAPDVMTRLRSKSQVQIVRPRISILGASTRELVNSAVGMLDWHAGKMARYLVCCAKRPRDKEMESEQDFPGMVQVLQDELNYLVGPLTLPTVATLSDEAWKMVQSWDKDPAWLALQARAAEHLKPSFSRAKAHVLRIAALYEASARPGPTVEVQPDSALPAILFVEHCMRSLVDTFSLVVERTSSPLERVQITLKAAGAAGMSRSALIRNTRLLARQLDDALCALRVGDALLEEDRQTGGRPLKLYRFVDHDE